MEYKDFGKGVKVVIYMGRTELWL